jgi:TolB-like protein
MSSLIEGYNYDIFISYRQKDNKHDGWVTEFVNNLKGELESTFKEEISVYFDINPHDGLLETHDVDASLKEKLRCLIFIPIISRTYCDPKSFAWEHEIKAFVEMASTDHLGLKVQLPNGNVGNRILPVIIHDIDPHDIQEYQSLTGIVLRGIEFIYREPGVNKPLFKTDPKYPIRVNKSAIAIKEIIRGLRNETEYIVKEEFQSNIEENQASKKSIIVLPFDNLSSDPEQEYFSDGLTEEIITDLSYINDLLVISRSSAMTFKGSKKAIPEIAREVNVRYVLEGSVRKAGNNLRIVAQLIDAKSDSHLWAEKFNGTLEDIFDIQEKVSKSIAEALKLKLKHEEQAKISRSIKDIRVFDFYLQARNKALEGNAESIDSAIKILDNAQNIFGDNSFLLTAKGEAKYMLYELGSDFSDKNLSEIESLA